MWALIQSDFRRYEFKDKRGGFMTWAKNPAFMPIATYRFVHYLGGSKSPILRKLWSLPITLLSRRMETKYGIRIPPKMEIGPGFAIWHCGMTVLHNECKIGSNCNMRQGTTIGSAGRGAKRGAPNIGNRVDIGVNAVLIGKITIGDDALIGAAAVIRSDVPPRAVVVGDPQRIVSYRGSFDYVKYPGMDTDPERLASKALAHAGLTPPDSSASETASNPSSSA
jgi:serine O-acetyltransferase